MKSIVAAKTFTVFRLHLAQVWPVLARWHVNRTQIWRHYSQHGVSWVEKVHISFALYTLQY